MTGLQFTVVPKSGSEKTELLKPIGSLEGSCRTLVLEDDPISNIRASWNPLDNSVSAARFYKGGISGKKISFGELQAAFREWQFDDENLLIGAHGYV